MSEIIENGFEKFGFSQNILKGVLEAGFKVPSPIQAQAIPLIKDGKDVIGLAHTGTGKTAAFGLPAMDKLSDKKGVDVLVIAPTRELAAQVSDELYKLGRYTGLKTATVYGGQSASRQISFIENGAKVVAATPGRLLDLLSSGRLKNFNPKIVVLDEADEMLDMGFHDDIMEIFKFLPEKRQTLLFSATMDKRIKDLISNLLKEPEFVSVNTGEKTNSDIKQSYYLIEENERDSAIVRLIESEEPSKAIVFCRMKREVDRLANVLNSQGVTSVALHGDMEQRQREESIKTFKSGRCEILVATDVAARGLDVSDVSHVYNYHIPFDTESYVHRIGRTGRAGKSGIAITLVTPIEYKGLEKISKVTKSNIEMKLIPTASELKGKRGDKLAEKIKSHTINPIASEILKELENDMDTTQLALKTISALIEDEEILGPDRIGLNEKSIDRVKQAAARQKDDSRRSNSGRRGSFRGNRSGSSSRGRRSSHSR
jgi:ATP-dependent RNA helicase DeaD